MIRAFIIEYNVDGKTEFANVVEYKHSPSVFYITPIATDYKNSNQVIILREVDGEILPTLHSAPVEESLLATLTAQIRKHISSN